MTHYQIHTALAGAYLAEGDTPGEAFEATPEEAIEALLDEASFQLDEGDLDDEVHASDLALLESLRGSEGRGDLLHQLTTAGSVGIHLDAYANGYGGVVMVYERAYGAE